MEDNDEFIFIDTPHIIKKKTIIEYTVETYDKGFIDGLREFAWWAEGQQFVGTNGTTLKEAIETFRNANYYSPPKVKL